jgi:gamma-glutamylcyclotransferase (GGCT)/AIG2-like uncharacterized protein YtfP
VYYFAYASNLNQKQMRERCPDSQPKFTAVLPNYRVVFTGWSRIKSLRGEKVRGAIYEVTEACLKRLDRYETGYERLNVIVFDDVNQPFPAVTYIRSGQQEESSPSKEYLAVIRQGYQDWGIF